jgi:hypothetical protein
LIGLLMAEQLGSVNRLEQIGVAKFAERLHHFLMPVTAVVMMIFAPQFE